VFLEGGSGIRREQGVPLGLVKRGESTISMSRWFHSNHAAECLVAVVSILSQFEERLIRLRVLGLLRLLIATTPHQATTLTWDEDAYVQAPLHDAAALSFTGLSRDTIVRA
jgi:hypothetical protein